MIFIAAPVFGITPPTPDEWQKEVNYYGNYALTPNGGLAILIDCGFITEMDNLQYRILFGTVHGTGNSAPNMPYYPGNNFVIHLGYGENGYTGPWGYEVFVEPNPGTYFTVLVGVTTKKSQIFFLKWNHLPAEEFKRYCGNSVPFAIVEPRTFSVGNK